MKISKKLLLFCSILMCISVASVAVLQSTSGYILSVMRDYVLPKREVKSRIFIDNASSIKWERTKLGSGAHLSKLAWADATHGWVGSSGGGLYRTTDGGKTWQQISIDFPQGGYVTSIFFANESTGWISIIKRGADSWEPGGTESKVLHTSDGGMSWQTQYADKGIGISRVTFLNGQEGWAVGRKLIKRDVLQNELLILYTLDQGSHWIDASSQANQLIVRYSGSIQDSVLDVCAVDSAKAIFLTDEGRILSTDNGGRSWIQFATVPSDPPQTSFNRLGYTQNKRLWIVGGTDSREGMWGLLVYKDKDDAWVKYRSDIRFNDAIFLSDSQVVACGSMYSSLAGKSLGGGEREGVFLQSVDGGLNWTILYHDKESENIRALSMIDKKSIWAVGDNGIILKFQF